MMRTYVIAEAGSCHDADWRKVEGLLAVAKDAGASALKLQWTSDPRRMAVRRHAPAYMDAYNRYLTFPTSWHVVLNERCKEAGLDYMCTVYLREDVSVVAPYVRHFKVASFEAADAEFLEAHLPYLKRHETKYLIASHGMGVRWPRAVKEWPAGVFERLRNLWCVSAYPAPVDQLNLLQCLGYDGFSDHSDPALIWTGALAVASGARIVEAHLKLYETDAQNPDAPHAMTPEQFHAYVRHIRFAETALGDITAALRTPLPAEEPMLRYRVVV